jgi:putative ABC transport system permease protein
MESSLRDFRFAFRSLLKNRGFTVAALLCLALGVGASSAIYSVVQAVLLKPLPFGEPDRVVRIWNRFLLQDMPKLPSSGLEFLDLREQATSFEEVAALAPQLVSLTGEREPRQLLAARASASLFPVLGVEAAMGRVFSPEEDRFGQNDVALLDHSTWNEVFGSDPGVVGRTILLDGNPHTVIGILPESFSLSDFPFEIWLPQGLNLDRLPPRNVRFMSVLARLKPGIGLDQAQAELDLLARRFQQDYPESYPAGSGWGMYLVPAHEDLVGEVRTTLMVLFGTVGLVLLIACANVANLLLARATSRSREIAIRAALGSSRAVLVRQFVSEGLVLSVLGAAFGLLLAFWAVRSLAAFDPGFPRMEEVRLDGGVLLFTFGLAVALGIVFGLVPIFQSSWKNLRDPLQEGSKSSAGAANRKIRSALVVAEIAIALVVLIGAGLMVGSFRRLLAEDPGFRPQGLLTVQFSLARLRYPEDSQVAAFHRELLERVPEIPGVESAAVASHLPLAGGLNLSGDLLVEGRLASATETPPMTGWRMVTPDYFETLGIPLLEGRSFSPADREDAAEVVIVDRRLAGRLWPEESPLGKRLKLLAPTPEQSGWRTVVGVAGEVRQLGLGDTVSDQLYLPLAQYTNRGLSLVVRTSSAPEGLAPAVREAIWSVDRDLPIDVQTMEQRVHDSLSEQRFNTFLFSAFGAVALGLTVIGVYGVMAYSVVQRTRDVGIRMALGARKQDVLRLIVGQGAALVFLGIVLGVAVAWGLSRLMSSLLYGVEATDLATFAGVSAMLGMLGLLASYFPARRAARVDPVIALRDE